MAILACVPVVLQMQVVFIHTRSIYEIRERPSCTYSWTALVAALILSELPFNLIGSTIFYLLWYFLMGLPPDRAGFTFLLMGIVFPCYYTTFGLAVAAMAPNAEVAGNLYNFFTILLVN